MFFYVADTLMDSGSDFGLEAMDSTSAALSAGAADAGGALAGADAELAG